MAEVGSLPVAGTERFGDDKKSQDEESVQGAAAGSGHAEEYTVEQVERVYRKLDLRIIPGRNRQLIPYRSCYFL